jgi:hypothetical protein
MLQPRSQLFPEPLKSIAFETQAAAQPFRTLDC